MTNPQNHKENLQSSSQNLSKAEIDWGLFGLPGFHMNLLLAPHPHRLEELGGVPGQYKATFTLCRPGFSLQPEYNLDLSGNLNGDSHLAIKKPAVIDPNNPDVEHIKLYSNTNDGRFIFKGYPNGDGYLSRLEAEYFHGENLADATIKAFRALTPVLSNISVYVDVPLSIYRITVELRNNNTRLNLTIPYLPAPLVKVPIDNLRTEYRVYAGLYREALNSNSLFYQFLCYHKIIEGIRTRRDGLSQEMIAKGETPQFPSERVPDSTDKQIKWLNSLFPIPQQWSEMALDSIFPKEAVGRKINRVIGDELTQLRNRIAHTFLESGEPGLFVDDVLYICSSRFLT